MTTAPQVDYQTNPAQYKHIQLAFDGEIATLSININEDAGIRPGYKLKLNSYDSVSYTHLTLPTILLV